MNEIPRPRFWWWLFQRWRSIPSWAMTAFLVLVLAIILALVFAPGGGS
jgi:hypothetical protein